MDLDFSGLLYLFALFLSFITTTTADDCNYRRYVSGLLPGYLVHRNVTIAFQDLSVAKDACNLLGSECRGINLQTSQYSREFVLASSGNLNYARGRLAWLKTCNEDCGFRLVVDHVRRRRYYRMTCRRSPTLEQQNKWTHWSPWGRCSQSCGELGEQLRFRQCRIPEVNCSGNNYQRRVCNFARKCPSTLSDVFGVFGTEGFQIAGSTPIYSTCIRTEQEEKIACGGDPNTVTRERCTEQYDCCYANDTVFASMGEPRCFQPKRFIGTSGMIGWSVWSPWTICSKSCENGTRSRSRICTGSIPSSAACAGSDRENEICSYGSCPCTINPCHNSGVCIPDDSVSKGYICECPSDFIGRHCDYGKPNLVCGNDSISVSFDRRAIPDEGLIDDARYIHFQGSESPQCFATLNKDRTEYILSIPPPIDKSCGSVVNITGDEYTIQNKVLWRLSDQSASSTVILLDLTCIYDKKLNMTAGLGFGIQPTVRTLAFQTERSTFHVDMRLYRSQDYLPSSLFVESPTVAEGEVLYVSVDLRTISITNPENEALFLEHCYATDTSTNKRPIYDFILNGCSTNPGFTTVLENGVSSRGRWGFRVFEWTTLSDTSDIFIVCKVFVCDTGFEVCTPSCDDRTTQSSTFEIDDSDETSVILQDLIDSLAANNNSNSIRKRRAADNKIITGTLDEVSTQLQSIQKKGKGLNRFFVSKKIKMMRSKSNNDRIISNVLTQSFGTRTTRHRFRSSLTEDKELTCGLTSMILVGIGSIAVYVLVNFAVKRMVAHCSS